MRSSDPDKPGQAYPWADVHVFVSSTFNDMHGERDYLVKEVFPELRDWCEERKLRLVDIDLRWGVSEADATHNKRVVDVCLRNVDNCRPFFLCFLGQRYGWVPGPEDVTAETLARFPGVAAAVADQRSLTEMEIMHAVLAPFMRGEQMVVAEHSFFYLREPGYLDHMPAEPAQLRRAYSDAFEEDPESRAFLVDRQNGLRATLRRQNRRPSRSYTARWQPEQRTPELAMAIACPASLPENRARWRRDWLRYGGVVIPEGALDVPVDQVAQANAYNECLCAGRLGDFWAEGRSLGDVIVADLKAAILERYPDRADLPVQDDLSREIDQHEDFIRTATDVFIAREGDFAALDAYAGGDSRNLFALVAPAGLGKSTLLANWAARWRAREGKPENESLLVRFVGVGERSNSVDSLLRSILEELRRVGKLASEIPDNANLLRSKFAELLGEAGKQGRVVVVIDALNQLQSGLSDLDWAARVLPENVKLIMSFKLGDEPGDALASQLRADTRVTVAEVAPFTCVEHREALVAAYLRQYLKELDQQHLHALVRADGAENPLFLKVVLTELRVFGAFAQLGEVIKQQFGTTPQSAFEAVLSRLESDASRTAIPPKRAVPMLFGLLAHSRGGLPEDLLVDMFLDDLGFDETRTEAMRATIRLYLRQVRPFLARRDGRTDFFYDAFKLAARGRYAGEGDGKRTEVHWHHVLAGTCEKWNRLTGEGQRYALGNLVQHQVAAGNVVAAAEVMTDFGYHHERLRVLGQQDVVNVTADFFVTDRAGGMGTAVRERFGIWKTFHAENAHVLRRQDPHLTPETSLLQLAVAHAETSPVTQGAERWLETVGSQTLWMRSLRRPHEVMRSACVRTLEGHTGNVTAVAVLPDGKRALSGSLDDTVKVWDLETGQCVRTLEGHAECVYAVAVLPDGKRALSGSNDHTVKLWDLETGQCVRTLEGHTDDVNAVAVLPDGKRALSGSGSYGRHKRDHTLKVWDLETGQCVRTLEGHTGAVNAVAVLPDGKRALSAGSSDGTLKVWNLETGQCVRTLEGHGSTVDAVAVLPDGEGALVGSRDGTVKLWDLETGQCVRTLKGHTRNVNAVAVLPDGKRALTGSSDETVKLWDLERDQCVRTLDGHTGKVNVVAVLPDGKRALTGGGYKDKTVKVWDLETGQCVRILEGHTDGVTAVAVLPDGKRALTGGGYKDKTVKVWDLETGQCVRTLEGHTNTVEAIAVLPDGRRALTGSALDTTVKVWDLETGQCVRTLDGHTRYVTAVAVLPDGKRALTGSDDKTVRLWDLETGQCVHTLEGHTRRVTVVAVLPDGKRALTRSAQNTTLKVWDLETGECVRTLEWHTRNVGALVVLPDGKRAVSGSHDGTVKLWDLETGQCMRTLEGHTGDVYPVAVLPDGKRALSGSHDGTVKLWDLETGQCLETCGQTDDLAGRWAVTQDTFIVGTDRGEVLILRIMPPGRATPETTAATWHPMSPLLAVSRADGTLMAQAWHPEAQHLEELLRTTIPSVTSFQWSADGTRLLATTRDGATHILDGATLQPASAPSCAWLPATDTSSDGRWRAVIDNGQLTIAPVSASQGIPHA